MLDKEFPGNVRITVSEKETRIWVCDANGCKFRFKAKAKTFSCGMDYTIMPQFYNKELVAALEACVDVMQEFPTLNGFCGLAALENAKQVLVKAKG